MNELNNMLRNPVYWDKTLEKICNKPRITKKQVEELKIIRENQIDNIIDEIYSGTYVWQIPVKKKIHKPGTNRHRVVYIYSIKDRLVLGVLYRVFQEYFKDRISKHCFSYKTGENTGNAVNYLRDKLQFISSSQHFYGCKIDIHAYFNSVQKSRISSMIKELFDGGIAETLNNLFMTDRVLENDSEIEEFKQLIPGSQISSFFANYCLVPVDEYFDKQDCVYVRYSDDIIIVQDNKNKLDEQVKVLLNKISLYGLQVNPDKFTYFNPGEQIEFLGLQLNGSTIDIQNHAKLKIKNRIKHYCRVQRKKIELKQSTFDVEARKIIRLLNQKNFKCSIDKEQTFGWCGYAFPRINTIKSLTEIDFFTRDQIRALKTGKHNKNNVNKVQDDEILDLGWVSLVDLYKLYKSDYDYYLEIVELL